MCRRNCLNHAFAKNHKALFILLWLGCCSFTTACDVQTPTLLDSHDVAFDDTTTTTDTDQEDAQKTDVDDDDAQNNTPLYYTKVATGNFHACALVSDQSIRCWGSNADNRLKIPEPNQDFVDLSAGTHHTCAIKTDGTPVCWGREIDKDNDESERGRGKLTPPSDISFDSIIAGYHHTCGIVKPRNSTPKKQVLCWGENSAGQLDITTRDIEILQVALAQYSTCVLYAEKLDGSELYIECTDDHKDYTEQFPSNTPFTQLTARTDFYCALDNYHQVKCHGQNPLNNATIADKSFKSIVSLTRRHACGILKDTNTAICWGSPNAAQNDAIFTIPDDLEIAQISVSNTSVCYITTDHVLECQTKPSDDKNNITTPPSPNN